MVSETEIFVYFYNTTYALAPTFGSFIGTRYDLAFELPILPLLLGQMQEMNWLSKK